MVTPRMRTAESLCTSHFRSYPHRRIWSPRPRRSFPSRFRSDSIPPAVDGFERETRREMVISLAFVVLLFSSVSIALHLPPKNVSFFVPSATAPPPSPSFLKDLVKAIAARERWDLIAGARVSEVDLRGARAGGAQRYEFRVRAGRTALVLKFSDDVEEWRKVDGGAVVEDGPDLVAGDGVPGLRSAVNDLELEGPLELRVGDGSDRFSLHLPALNVTHRGLRRILVGDGTTVKVAAAQEISLIHPYDIGLSMNGSFATHGEDHNQFWPLGHSSCSPLLSIIVVGSTSIVASRTRNSEAYVETSFRSHDTVELPPEKCYHNVLPKRIPSCTSCSLSSKLALLEKLLRNLVGAKVFPNRSLRFLKAKITASTLIKFRLALERDITGNDKIWKNAADWRTKPKVEHVWFEIVARVDGRRQLKPVIAKKLNRPYIIAESTAWSNLMSNISFTQFRSLVAPPEALTLDVRW